MIPNIYVISGGLGTGAERIVRATLAQFNGVEVPIHLVPHVTDGDQLERVMGEARANNGIIVHTLVNTDLRNNLINIAHNNNIQTVDLQGPLLLQLTRLLGRQPAEEPGLYDRLRAPYFKRIEVMEFAVEHDDGRRLDELHLAEIVLTGVSRVGKTPLSMYLAAQGWRVANVPLMREVEPPPQLFEIDSRRVIGLKIEPGQLVAFRSNPLIAVPRICMTKSSTPPRCSGAAASPPLMSPTAPSKKPPRKSSPKLPIRSITTTNQRLPSITTLVRSSVGDDLCVLPFFPAFITYASVSNPPHSRTRRGDVLGRLASPANGIALVFILQIGSGQILSRDNFLTLRQNANRK